MSVETTFEISEAPRLVSNHDGKTTWVEVLDGEVYYSDGRQEDLLVSGGLVPLKGRILLRTTGKLAKVKVVFE